MLSAVSSFIFFFPTLSVCEIPTHLPFACLVTSPSHENAQFLEMKSPVYLKTLLLLGIDDCARIGYWYKPRANQILCPRNLDLEYWRAVQNNHRLCKNKYKEGQNSGGCGNGKKHKSEYNWHKQASHMRTEIMAKQKLRVWRKVKRLERSVIEKPITLDKESERTNI